MKKTPEKSGAPRTATKVARPARQTRPVSAESIARRADAGEDVSKFFAGKGRMVRPIQRVNVEVTAEMLRELDRVARQLNISRQAVMKTLIRQALDQHYLAQRSRPA